MERNLAISNSKFNVFYDHLISQDGEEIDDFIIIKPKIKNSENIAGICVIPFFNKQFFLMKGWRHQFDDFIFQAPSGFVEDYETSSESAIRELFEETALVCKPQDMIQLGTFLPDAGLIEGYVSLFLAINCQISDNESINEIGTGKLFGFTINQLEKLINKESKIGGSTLVACFRALNYLKINKKS